MKNAYAAKLQAQRVHLRNEERADLIHRILTTVYQASAVVLNQEFGFGADRIPDSVMRWTLPSANMEN